MARIVHFSKIPSPYRIPLFRVINACPDVELVVVYLAATQPNRPWKVPVSNNGYREVILSGTQTMIWKMAWPIHINRGVWDLLRKEKPDAIVVAGYESLAFWQALLYARLTHCRFVLWSGAIKRALHVTRGPVNELRRIIIRSSDAILAYGTDARSLLIEYGARPEKIITARNTVDVNSLATEVRSLLAYRPESDPEVFNLLYVGQLIQRKAVDQVIRALASIRCPNLYLTIVGEGSDKPALIALTEQLGLFSQVAFTGYKQYDEMPDYYARADALIMPSYEEIWGLVVNEALAAGLPVLASIHAGATTDLITDANGLRFNPANLNEIEDALRTAYDRRQTYRQQREQIMQDCLKQASLDQYADAFVSAALGG